MKKLGLFIFGILVLILISIIIVDADVNKWNTELVDKSGDVGQYDSIAFDSNNNPHIVYYDATNWAFKYAYWNGSQWHIETIDKDNGANGGYTSIAIDSNNHPHISYWKSYPDSKINYAYYNGTNWQFTMIDNIGVTFVHTSIAVDLNNHPHISYGGDTNRKMKYAYFNGSNWTKQIVDYIGDGYTHSSIAIDSDNKPHISYFYSAYDGSYTKYAYFNGSNWSIQKVDSSGFIISDLAIDSNNNPHISYYGNYPDEYLRYASWNGSNWTRQTVEQLHTLDSGGSTGFYNSIALDSNNNPHISYYDFTNKYLKYAKYNGTEWDIKEVDTGEDVGQYNSIALDSNNNPHISYYDSRETLLKHANYNGFWNIEIVDRGDGSVGFYTSIALDSNNNPHISYYDFTTKSLVYTYLNKSSWRIKTVDRDYNKITSSGFYTSIALDSNNNPHISYLSYNGSTSRNSLKYANYNGSKWSTKIIDNYVGNVNDNTPTSIAFDSNNNPHIGYSDLWNGSNVIIKYAYYNGSNWTIQTVDSFNRSYGATTYLSLDLDLNNLPHMSYYEHKNKDLKYAYFNGANWIIERVDTNGDVGYSPSIKIDKNNHPHIAYRDFTNNRLRYAYFNGVSWTIETIDRNATYISLALDLHDKPYIAYAIQKGSSPPYDYDLMYAYKNSSSWHNETADTIGNVGHWCSIALDSKDRPHISYMELITMSTFHLKYAYLSGYNININLNQGWNLISIPLVLQNDSIESVFGSIMDKIIVINSFENGIGGGARTYDPQLPEFSDLHNIDYKHGYWVKMNQSANLSIIGTSPENKTINLVTGWNLISYLCNQPKNVSDVFAGIMNKLIVVNGFENGALTYDPQLPEFSDLQELKPYHGYWVKMNESATLNYNNVC